METITKYVICCSEFSFRSSLPDDEARDFAEMQSYQSDCSKSAEYESKTQAMEALKHCCCQLSRRAGFITATMYWLNECTVTVDDDGDEIDSECFNDRVFADWR